MNRYPLWKNLIIIISLVLGFAYTLPNFYGEAPAVQVSPLKTGLKADAALMNRVEEALKQGNLAADGIFLDQTSVKARFPDTDTQLRAKDLLQSQLGEDYVVALNLLSNSPRWLAAIGALPMYLGLDLRGGVHFLLQVDMKAAITKKMDAFVGDIRSALRDKRIQYGGVTRDGQTITVRFRDAAMRDKATAEIQKNMPDLELKNQDETGEYRIVATLKLEAQRQTEKFALDQNITTLRNRVNELGVAEPIIQQQGSDRVVVQLPGVQDTAKAKDILGRTATLEVRMVEAHAGDPGARNYDPQKIEQAVGGQIPFGTELFYAQRESGKEPLLLSKQIVITGDRLTDASPGFDATDQRPIVSVTLDGQGARIFQQVTREAVKRRMAILLIDRGKPEVLTAPVIQSELGARFQITGFRSTEETKDLALLLRAGALAAPMEIVEERTVGPSLGAENIRIGFNSALYGFAAITAFMIVYYALFGVFSIVALAGNVLFLVALLSMLQATLTLPGMAAIALTIGMAIDANVLINERIREELRNGNTPQAAIHAGYDRAWGTILDSNLTTLIAGVFLFILGSGPVKGFAVVLCLGILTSQFSAVMVARGMSNFYYGRRRRLDRISIGQIWRPAAQGK
ncbi:MAG: protein-export membrane protein SecD [Betaproteobacteria bacterium RIFCSPLOWO2_12_FULL_62_13]|nr:MAG: protein-export membrane protein SecD [Betaproteobacteria bacterium RIFCSPLOWO2_12_FULL_62_13]